MPSVIDQLFVELGIDAAKFTQGQRDALDSLRKLQDEMGKTGKGAEAEGTKLTDFFSNLKRQAIGLAAVFMGGRGVKEFGEYITHLDANVGRLSNTLNMSTRDVSAWQMVARQFGGTNESVAGSMQGLTDEIQRLAITGQSRLLPVLQSLNIPPAEYEKWKSAGDMFLAINHAIQGMDPARARGFMLMMGLDNATVNMLLSNSKTLETMLKTGREIGGTTKESADAAMKLESAWSRILQRVEEVGRKFLPMALAITGLIEYGMDKIGTLFGGKMHPPPSGAGVSGKQSMTDAETEAAIRAGAIKRGMDPDVAVKVWDSEGRRGYVGDRGSSFGPFQLHYGGVAGGGMAVSGLGDSFTKMTGLDARNPTTQQQQIDFSLDWARKNGWGAWHGWRGAPFAGIPAPGSAGRMGSAAGGDTTTTTVTIGNINVNAPNAKDAGGIARDINGALRRETFAAQANSGLR